MNLYKIILENREYHIETELNTPQLIEALSEKIIGKTEYFALNYNNFEPVYFRKDKITSIQKVYEISPQSRKWRLL